MNSLERAIKLLEMMGRHSGGLTNSQISRYLDISTSSTSYLLSQLEREGCVKRDEDTGRYQVGLRLVSLAHGALRATGFHEQTEAVLHELADAARLTVTVGALERDEVLLIETVRHVDSFHPGSVGETFTVPASQRPARTGAVRQVLGSDIATGVRVPIFESASGRALAAFLPPERVIALLGKYGRASREPKVRERLLEELNQVRNQGYAAVNSAGIRSVAAPITTRINGVLASLAVVGSTSNRTWSDSRRIVNLVCEAARNVSRRAASDGSPKSAELPGRFPKGTATLKAIIDVR